MPLALPLLIPFAEIAKIAIGAVTTGVGLKALSDKVEDYIEDNPEKAEKIFAMIMPEQGLASIFNTEADDGEEISETEVEVEKPKLTGKEKGMRIKEAIRKARAGKGNYSSEDAEGPAVDIRGSVIREVEDMGMADKNLKDNYKKSNFDYKKYFRKADGGMMEYANGGGVGSMMEPKKKKNKTKEPVVQGGVDNYLGKQPQVQAPRTWQSSPDKPATELAYITKAEKDLIIKKNIHGGLEGGPNMGPSGIMSLDSFGDVGGAGASGGDTDTGGGASQGPGTGGGGFSGRNTNTTSARDFDRQKANQRAVLQMAERKQADDLVYNERQNITGIDRSNPNYNRSGIFGGFNPLSMIAGLIGGPFAGLAVRGLTGIKNKFNDVTNNPDDLSLRERLTGYKTQADYEKARADRQTASRRDKMQDRIDQGYNSMFGMKTGPITDQQRATLANLNTQTGVSNAVIGGAPTSTRFSDFAPRIGLQTQPNTKSFYENEMSIPTQPQGLSMMEDYYNSIYNKATGPNIVPDASTLAQQAKTFNTTDALNTLGNTTEKGFFGTSLTDKGKGLESFRNSAVNFYNSPNNTNKTAQSALNFMSDRPGLYGGVIENKDFIQNAINQGFLQTEDDYKNQESLEDFI